MCDLFLVIYPNNDTIMTIPNHRRYTEWLNAYGLFQNLFLGALEILGANKILGNDC